LEASGGWRNTERGKMKSVLSVETAEPKMVTPKPIFDILTDRALGMHYFFSLRDIMSEHHLFANEAQKQIGQALDERGPEILDSLFSGVEPKTAKELCHIPIKVVLPMEQHLTAMRCFYRDPIQFGLEYLGPPYIRGTTYFKDAQKHGLNIALTNYVQVAARTYRTMTIGFIFREFFHNAFILYYEATEEEWCFLLEIFQHPNLVGDLLNAIWEHHLLTKASLRALARYNYLNKKVIFDDWKTTLLVMVISLHLTKVMEQMLELGAEESGEYRTYHMQDTEILEKVRYTSVKELLHYYLGAPNLELPDELGDDSKIRVSLLKDVRRKERPQFLRTLRHYIYFTRSPLLKLRQRYWEEYWKRIESNEP
jgi:hypothetical protein